MFCNDDRKKEILFLIAQIIECPYILTKQIKMIILGLIIVLNQESFLQNSPKDYMEILDHAFNLLYKQKKEESIKLKIELKNDLDCQFLEEEKNEDDDDNSDKEKQKDIYHENDEDNKAIEESIEAIKKFKSKLIIFLVQLIF